MDRDTRRRFIARIAALLALPFSAARIALAQTESVEMLVRRVTRGALVNSGRITLDLPLLADNGNSVSLKVSVDCPMNANEHVRSIHLFAEKNPRSNIANFYLNPLAGRAQVAARIRLAGTQRVLAIAALSDGSFWSGFADVVVTSTACWDES